MKMINEYRSELKDAIKAGIVKDPALYWAGKMSQYIKLVCSCPLGELDIEALKLMNIVRIEYDNEIYSRMK